MPRTICAKVPHFSLTLLIGGSSFMKRWHYRLAVLLLVIVSCISNVQAQAPSHQQHDFPEANPATADVQEHTGGHGEGSPDEMDFTEFHHHVAGFFILVFGLAELGNALRYPLPIWTRFILPGALSVIGLFVLFGDDHSALPVGSINFVEIFSGQDRELIEHKLYGLLSITIAIFEALRRSERVRHPLLAAPLVLLTFAGSLWLFIHSHGDHPALTKIQLQHSMLGIVGIGAALSKGLASWLPGASPSVTKRWEVAWAGSEILFGLLLLVYSQ